MYISYVDILPYSYVRFNLGSAVVELATGENKQKGSRNYLHQLPVPIRTMHIQVGTGTNEGLSCFNCGKHTQCGTNVGIELPVSAPTFL